jgi:hypothetical protein
MPKYPRPKTNSMDHSRFSESESRFAGQEI